MSEVSASDPGRAAHRVLAAFVFVAVCVFFVTGDASWPVSAGIADGCALAAYLFGRVGEGVRIVTATDEELVAVSRRPLRRGETTRIKIADITSIRSNSVGSATWWVQADGVLLELTGASIDVIRHVVRRLDDLGRGERVTPRVRRQLR